MALSHDSSGTVEKATFNADNLNPHTFWPYKENGDISCEHKRLKWNNNFQNLQRFFSNIIGVSGKWSSPGGGSKKFTGNDIELIATWYYGRQKTLLFQGGAGHSL